MKKLKLHSFGQNDHVDTLKKKYDSLRKRINGDKKLTESEKVFELKNLIKLFEKEKRDSKKFFY